MAEPYLICPKHWLKGTLEPNPKLGLINTVDSGGTPSTTRDEYWEGTIPWVTPREVCALDGGMYVSSTERMITEAGLANSAAKLLPVGTVMLTKRAPVGEVAVNVVPMATNQGFLNFRCGSRLRPLYLAYWLKVNRPYLEQVAIGSTYPELYIGDLFEFEIAVPEIAEQDHILEFINALQFVTLLGGPLQQSALTPQAVVAIQQQNARLVSIRESIFPLLFSGELSLSNKS